MEDEQEKSDAFRVTAGELRQFIERVERLEAEKKDIAEQIKEVMAKSNRLGMKTFDQDLFDLYEAGTISYEDAMRNADSKNELRLRIKLEGKREAQTPDGEGLEIMEDSNDATFSIG